MLTGTLGHYRIVRLLGSGGMGEVYLAEDEKLGRQVALKILPPELTADAARRERFEREARAVAALNHPSIVTLHSIDQVDQTPFLTMEFVDGKPLGELIPKQGMPLDRLLKIAIPLADAVGAAHQRGILHRDLKPANVMVTPDGRVKVLDFGLAKLEENVSATDALPTQELTGEGRIVGTVAYMSPEQAEGKTVDQRSDVFSLGVLFYELATAQRPFVGDTSLSVLSAILKDTPRPMADLRPDLPRDFTRIVKRALNKDPEERYQSAKDLRNDLHAVQDDLTSGELARPAAAALTPRTRALTPTTIVAVAALAVAAVVAVWALTMRSPVVTPASAPASPAWTPVRLTSNGLVRNQAAISADGRYVAYARGERGGASLILRQIATNSEVVVRPQERVNIAGVAFSRDASFIYYNIYPVGDNAATLYRVPAIGGAPQRLTYNVDSPVTFAPDGGRLAFVVNYPSEGRSTLEVAGADGSGRRVLADLKRPNRFLQVRPAWSPDGATIAIGVIDGPGQAVALVDAATGALRVPGERRWAAAGGVEWLPGGRELIVTLRDTGVANSQIWRLDAASGAATGITRDLFSYGDIGASADGRSVVAIAGLGESTLWTAEADKLPAIEAATTGAADGEGAQGVAWTHDGGFVYVSRASGNLDLWSLDPKLGTRRQLTSDPADDVQPAVSPDGRSIAFASGRDGGHRIWVMNVDGSEARAVSPGPTDAFPSWSPDGASMVFIAGTSMHQVSARGTDVRPLTNHWPARTGEPARTFIARAISQQGLAAGFEEVDPKVGGGWRLAYAPLDGSVPATLLEPTQATALGPVAWSADGRAIDVVRLGSDIWRYPIDGKPGFRLSELSGPALTRSFAWSPDGHRLLFSRGENKADVVLFKRDEGR